MNKGGQDDYSQFETCSPDAILARLIRRSPSRRTRFWLAAALILVTLVGGLGLTEATGVMGASGFAGGSGGFAYGAGIYSGQAHGPVALPLISVTAPRSRYP